MLIYKRFSGIPDDETIEGILKLHENIFGDSDTLIDKMKSKPKILINVALDESEVVGYKIGYELNDSKYYSWYGGVHVDYRGRGIALKLMEEQHRYITNAGYQVVQTKTRNKWRGMLVLNIKNGFDVIETFTDEDDIHRIVLEKKLEF
ncbi:GNAT family N-acetyltransferase [Sporosarcina sp. FA9]|uniref:GNAT family N-acetyltransferase n=1 Tax=Sporosarcina sp. FA9 TaxID=3413030 RepID=UPI003F65FC65